MRVLLAVFIGVTAVTWGTWLWLQQPRFDLFALVRHGLFVIAVLSIGGIFAVAADLDSAEPAVPAVVTQPATQLATLAQVEALVRESTSITTVPSDLDPPLTGQTQPVGYCPAGVPQSSVPICAFGDKKATRTLVLYGDSHAGMWFNAFDDITRRAGIRLIMLEKLACPAGLLSAPLPGGTGPWAACDEWHSWVVREINHLHPQMFVVTQEFNSQPNSGRHDTGRQWREGLTKLFASVHVPQSGEFILGNIPLAQGEPAVCLAAHPTNVQACSLPPTSAENRYNSVERTFARSRGIHYIDTTPWLCTTTTCSSIIGHFNVYYNRSHISARYGVYLEGVLAQALNLTAASK